jgi:hypothetical protein
MAFGNVIHQRGVTIIIEQPGLDAGNVLSQPFAVAGRHEHVLPAVQEQDRDGDVGEVESPRLEHAVVVPPSLAARRQPILRAGQKELVKLADPDLEGRICRRECRLDLPGRFVRRRGEDVPPVLVQLFRAAALSVRNSRVSSTLSWSIPAK